MPNEYYNLILVKGEDKTSDIVSWTFDHRKPVVWITYQGGKSFPYNANDVQFYKDPKRFSLNDRILLKKGVPCAGVKEIIAFEDYSRIYYQSGYKELVRNGFLQTVGSALGNEKSRNIFEYYKQIASQIGMKGEDGHNILAGRYEKIQYIREDSIIADFFKGQLSGNKYSSEKTAIYPFGFNLSQKQAVDNALNNRLSVIEGPPGTGKTQTILNIIANAVMRGESVAVVSSNNSATLNVYEKLQKYGVEFIAAQLGNTDNKQTFINSQKPISNDIKRWSLRLDEWLKNNTTLKESGAELDKMLVLKNEQSKISEEKTSLEKEYEYYSDTYCAPSSTAMPEFGKSCKAKDILKFSEEYKLRIENNSKLSFLQKILFKFRYKLKNLKFLGTDTEKIINFCQNEYYIRRLKEIDSRLVELNKSLNSYDFDTNMKKYSNLSMTLFRSKLSEYYDKHQRNTYELDDLWKHSEEFIKDYPVVLSTTYSLRSSLSSSFIYDYVIVDEASHVDLATGVLALSCAKKAVVVGDLKQLPNVVTPENRELTEKIFSQYNLDEAYNYASNSLLLSLTKLFPDMPRVLLREHYRCHPEIIGFCNQRFYNGELVVLTQPKSTVQPLVVYKTVAGNHARGHVNQRQAEVILNEVIPQQHLNDQNDSVGIVTPYRDQAKHLQSIFTGKKIKADTADKFQGQERDTIIFSTVDNEIGDFASDPNRLNVAVSRAVNQFIIVTDGNNKDETSPIHDLIGYIEYRNHDIVDSKISSVFDYLYNDAAEAREEILRKYGRINEIESENLMYTVISDVLKNDDFNKYGVVSHVPLRSFLKDLSLLDTRELTFASNHLTHVDFLIYSKLTHMPVLVIEVDGFAYHTANEKQLERDMVKNRVLEKYGIPIVRFNTIGSGEKEKLVAALMSVN